MPWIIWCMPICRVDASKKRPRSFSNSKTCRELNAGDFKIAYASTAMPVRYAVERSQWTEAAAIVPPAGAPPQVVAIAVWARGLGLARSGHAAEARAEIDGLRQIEEQLRNIRRGLLGHSGGDSEARSDGVVSPGGRGNRKRPAALMRASADEEDAIEKLPVTPGPIVPAREQLGDLLLEQNHPDLALKEFEAALANAPGRRGARLGCGACCQTLQSIAWVLRPCRMAPEEDHQGAV